VPLRLVVQGRRGSLPTVRPSHLCH
jgi:hypothetical protein